MTYLRWQRIVFFNITSALCTATAALAIWGLVTGYQQKHDVREKLNGATLHIQNAFAAGGSVAAASGLASLLCTFVLAMALFRRNKPETLSSVRLKEVLFGFSCLCWIGTLIPATYIWQTKAGVITKTGVPAAVLAQIVALGKIDLRYKTNKPLKSQIIVGWIAFGATLITTALVLAEARYVLKHGRDGPLIGHLHETETTATATDRHDSFEKRETQELA
ncbi:BZ3500_MvSof-1268-A1-R1_Chr9g10513 [Microbotryum saponariae]|uniref:BZ3500_MvSof-1268-A1-R1_Chr9g10513 protein n=1 Tax=Microbotryum saponariae TaxID=289078 RepID=A0A2X0L122_9BASI|nr:BZ3501_MvSof-1269-A2-R1_Chr9g10262 [Microbotryum saponariae]SDA00221.1 BZ3500_MvSof-1268-A1-R1_Chr9g10513 [Microbotryum saponariae]